MASVPVRDRPKWIPEEVLCYRVERHTTYKRSRVLGGSGELEKREDLTVEIWARIDGRTKKGRFDANDLAPGSVSEEEAMRYLVEQLKGQRRDLTITV